MGHLTARCLLMLALGVCAAAQSCDNTGQNCDDITNISQCTADVYSQCCSRCSSLAGCFNIATNCFTLNYYQCHLEVTRQQCCGMCEHRKKEFLGADCLYGDKIAGCEVGACGNSNVSDAACCETCFKGTTPMAVSQVTMVNPTTPTVQPATFPVSSTATKTTTTTTTARPNTTVAACTDQLSSCADTVKNVPSTCYNGEIRGVCCKSCSDFQTSRQNEGYDVQMCPYGDKNTFCIAENFNRNNCSNPDNQFWCCDSCRPLTTTMATTTDPQCMDTSVSGCNLPASFCYNNFYSSGCCATCRGQLKHDLSFECRYGDKAQNCDSLINPDGVCDDAEKEQCCEACARREMTTTQDSCQDTIGTCSGLVNGVAANCYLLGDSCCATCRPFRKNHLAESCLYGDRNAALCSADSCGGNLQNVCCETCASTTMVPPTTTPMCTDNIGNCMDGPLQLKNNPKLCYSPGTYADCCGSCNMLKTGPAMCEWGSRESVCSSLQNIDCSNDNIKSICCEQCMASVTVTPMRTTTMMIMTTMAPPSNCTDKLGNCEGLTESISNCYPGKFVGDNCCASCFLKKKPNLPEYCAWGDTLSLCGTFITDDMLCEQDAVLKKDCCETCLSFQAATTPFQPTVCPNVWADSTCERVLGQLSGDCSSIQDKCCRTCLVTTTPAVTTPPPTTDSCIDTLDEATCVSIVTAEGAGECETDFMQERCCFTCRRLVPTTQPPTTPPACLGDALPNCADIQELLVAQDICDMLSFKNSCCAFCQTTQSPTMTPTTTVLPPGCDGDVWSSLLCAATITTSPLAAPCEESDLIKENCCATCALITTTAAPPTTTTMMTSTGPVCTGDNPAINCAAVAAILDVCASSDFSLQCCDFCRPTTVTTVATTTRSGLCSTNAVPDEECQALFEAGGGLRSCATSVLILSCCKFCSSITFPPTTTGTTTVPCIGDNPGVNCSSVDGLLNGNLCTPVSSDLLRQSCCDYCANLPTTATTPEPPTTVCVDLSSELECDVLAATGSCSNSLGVSQCCATCALFNAPSTTPTTTEIPTTAECIDTGAINCSGVALRGVNPCTSDAVIRQACCEFCINYTTPAPPITPPPCFGNSIDVVLCESRQDENPDFCSFDPVFLPVCCEFCGAPVLSSSPGTGGVTPATNAPVTTAAAESTTAAQCVDNIFPEDTCNNILQLDPNSCSGSSFFDQCCKVCISRSPARRRRSVEEIDAEVELSRERRQADVPCTTVNPAVCEVIISSVGMSPDEQCNNEFVKETCCEYCQRVRAALPEGCISDIHPWNLASCALVINGEGIASCSSSPVRENCCLSCVLVPLRPESSTSPLPPTTTQPLSTAQPVECKQEWSAVSCQTLLSSDDISCSDDIVVSKCCDFSCISTTGPTTQPERTTVVTTTGVLPDPAPACFSPDNAQSCSRFVNVVPSGCYQEGVYADCCASCSEFYYERKGNGYNVEMCSYGNRDASCSANVDCSNVEEAKKCCDICFPKMDVIQRPIPTALTAEYVIQLAVKVPCPNSDSRDYVSNLVIYSLRTVFSVLPGTQTYSVTSIICDEAAADMPIQVVVAMTTPPTHSYAELRAMFEGETADGEFGVFTIDPAISQLAHKEFYNALCEADVDDNCDNSAMTPGSSCYFTVFTERCCVTCNRLAVRLYENRTYVPEDCGYGDKSDSCNADVDCSTTNNMDNCCHTCAVAAIDYTTPAPTTTPEPTTVATTTPQAPTAAPITTTRKPCIADTSDRCEGLVNPIRNCYSDQLVYEPCCKSCDLAILWHLPDNCSWGDKQPWCQDITQAQCAESNFYEACCETCGPRVTRASTIQPTTSIVPTTTSPCFDTRADCASIIVTAGSCYEWESECCATCAEQIFDNLNYTCRYGDYEEACPNQPLSICEVPAFAAQCCKRCSSFEPTTTMSTSTVTMPSTSDPGCVRDVDSQCNLLTSNGGCYNDDVVEVCCVTCEGLYDADAASNCRYGDHQDYCSGVTRERCLTEARVFTDCCKTCEGYVAPPGVCVDTAINCASLTVENFACYSDFVYSQCCETCEGKARNDLGPTCKWGDSKVFCSSYERDDCSTIDSLSWECCALCSEEVTTSPPPTTTTQPQCIDSPSAQCVEDTADKRFCYDSGVASDCCASCRLLANNRPSCLYGDREPWCPSFQNFDRCDEPFIRESCCELCAPATTTPMPTTSACFDAGNCSSPVSECYVDQYEAVCCATCRAAYDVNALFGCEYGDKQVYCQFVTGEQCLSESRVRQDCCKTCPMLTAVTTATGVTTTEAATTTAPPTTSPPICADLDSDTCLNVQPFNCYSTNIRDICCATCTGLQTDDASCLYGDREVDDCSGDIDCSLSVVRDKCCGTCAGFVIPSEVEAIFQLRVNVTNVRCTVGLNDKESSQYLLFKFNMQQLVDALLVDLPGIQVSELVNLTCGSVLAILDIRSAGFYDLRMLNMVIMSALSTGKLGDYTVSTIGSSLKSLSFEPPNCVGGDLSLNCLRDFVFTEPSKCSEPQVRSECCQSCSSQFYSRLAAGKDINSCPYGDRDLECFASQFIDCNDEEARERCCDRCADFTTTPPPTTTTTTTTTPPPTTTACVDNDTALCTRAVGNSLTFCYSEEAASCCATCTANKILWLPDECAWGDKKEFCSAYNESSCAEPYINASCCKLCGNNGVDPSAPCTAADNPSHDCSSILLTPALCYNSDYYDNCCQTCNSVFMDHLPQGCKWGNREEFCDSSAKICAEFGERLCCASCCSDCSPPTTAATTAAITTPAATTPAGPPGCSGDLPGVDCANIVSEPMDCYSNEVANLCCESCYNVRRTDLPDTCQYGDKLTQCETVTYAECASVGSACCETCYNLLDSICNDTLDTGVFNCEQTVTRAGTCYSKDTTDKCCRSCKEIVEFSLPPECRFGDKVSWCDDIDDANRDRICSQEDSQQQCCKTCSEYIARTIPPTTTTTTVPTTTRLPPNEQCPLGDVALDCKNRTAAVGTCYNPDVSENCCRTCYELWQDDLPSNCRYGDKSAFCHSTSDDQVDYEWCLLHGETCCVRCLTYLTTTVPTTTQLAACPLGNARNDCNVLVQSQHDCYSPVRADECCINCNLYLKAYLPSNCRYGDKARFCQDIQEDECDEHAETCCETCLSNVTTVATTVRPINRPNVEIGRGLFNRPVPSANITLYRVEFSMVDSCQTDDGDLANHESNKFKLKQNEVCSGMSGKMWSMTHCYVHSINCSDANRLSYVVYVLVDRSLNYDNVDDVTSSKINSELAGGEYIGLLTSDVNECETQNVLLQDGCHEQAVCTNTEGLYSCACPSPVTGDGFTCFTKLDPNIGRDSFIRSVPPAYQHLYRLQLQIASTDGQAHSCFDGMDDPQSGGFFTVESRICTALGDTLLSLHSCYVSDFDCSNGVFKVNAYILVDASINFPGQQVSEAVIASKLASYDGVIESSVVQDVNECTTQVDKLAQSCHPSATCSNSLGLYTCACSSGLFGDGFSCRPVPSIGRDLFNRPTPPGEIALFRVTFSQAESCQIGDAELQNVQSSKFGLKQNEICEDMSGKLMSMENCYVNSMTCVNGNSMSYVAYVLINRAFNYPSVQDVTANRLTKEIEDSQMNSFSYDGLLVSDVNECETDVTLLQDGCNSQASCTNTEGLYNCACPSPATGDGFTCFTRLDPNIGRDSFIRSVPPAYQHLYRLQLQIASTDGQAHSCFDGSDDPFSGGFLTAESRICTALGDTLLSLHSCYVSDFDCSNGAFKVNVYILVDASINYPGKQVSEGVIKNELASYNGVIESSVVQDVNECTTQVDELAQSCHPSATCSNSLGLYTCACSSGLFGDGFSCRPVPSIGRDLFNRPAPPGEIALFKVTFSQAESCQTEDAELQNVQSSKFGLKQNEICEDMSGKLVSMENCYMNSMTCVNGNSMSYVAYVLINRAFNYRTVQDVTANQLAAELESSQSRRKRALSYAGLLVSDVNECETDVALLQDGCHSQASCTNTEGLYNCACSSPATGDGFTCFTRLDPNIGRDSFIRSVPPAYQHLYRLQLQIASTDGYVHTCFQGIGEMKSDLYVAEESRICTALGDTLLSLYACYVSDFDCSNGVFKVNAYILVDASINFPNQQVSAGVIKSKLTAYNGKITSDVVRDVDECTTDVALLEDGCHQGATCANSEGLYTCACAAGLSGDGFNCKNETSVPHSAVQSIEDWAIAVIVVGAAIALLAIVLLIACCCRYSRRRQANHEQLSSGENTPPRQSNSALPPFYNSLRSTKAPPSDYGGSFFYPNQEQMPGYAMKTYNVGSNVNDTENDTTVFQFE